MFVRSHSIKDHPGQLAGAAGIAAAVGALGAVLLTPKRGSEVRHEIRQRGKKVKDKMSDMKSTTKEAAENTKSVAQSSTGRAKSTMQKVKDDAKASKDEAKSATNRTTRNSDVTDEIRRRGEP